MLAFNDISRVMAILFLAVAPLMFLMKRTGTPHRPVALE
jgi:hypothetical protein